VHERTTNGDALPHAAGQLVWPFFFESPQTGGVE
jgi:hypothetical protein